MAEFGIALVNITDGSVQGHKAGCADLKRGNLRKHADDVWTFDVASKAEAWANYNTDFIGEAEADGRNVEDCCYIIEWAPCAKHVPEGDKTEFYGETEPQAAPEPEFSPEALENARKNFSDLARTAPSESARAFWQGKVDAL